MKNTVKINEKILRLQIMVSKTNPEGITFFLGIDIKIPNSVWDSNHH